MAGPGSSHQTSSRNWRQIVTSLYPDALTRTYCVPPIHFNRVPYVRGTVPGTRHSALVLHPPSSAGLGHNVPAGSQGAATSSVQPGTGQPTPGGHQKKGKRPQARQPAHSRQFPYAPSVQWVQPFSGQATHGQQSTTGQSSSGQQSAQYSLWTPESVPPCTPVNVQQTDISDDFAQNHVMVNLQELGNNRHEAMFILSQLNFGDYLNQPAYAAAAAQFPRPSDKDTQQTKYSDGEADFVLIHRQHGILIGELKTVGRWQKDVNNPQPPADADVAKRVTKAVKQLDRSETVVRHLVSDVSPGMTVRKTLFLPYVSTEQLQRVLDNDPQLEQAVCRSLGAGSAADAVLVCCCSDQLSQPASYWHVTPAVLSQLSTWWQHRMACTVDTLLSDDSYLDIVARFVGPATTVSVPCYNGVRVEVRTAGQAVAELGWRLALLVLTMQQLDLLNRDPRLVCLAGLPGTGKTVALVLQGLRWLLQGHDVQVVSTVYTSRAASRMIAGQLGMALSADPTPPPTPGSIALHHYDFHNREADVQQAVTDLVARVKDGQLHVLLDEANFAGSTVSGSRHTTLVARLAESVPGLHLWAAGVYHTDIPPSLRPEPLTVPLRCAPSVLREVQTAVGRYQGIVHNYSDSGVPAPGDGLRVIRLSHHGNAHTGRWPAECRQCGKEVAAELRRLGVGSGGNSLPNSPAPLSYSDVFILTQSSELHDDIKNNAGQVTSRASDLVRGLRDEGLPVCVLGQQDWRHNTARWERDVHDVAVAATDRVTVTRYNYVQGLERRVVVVLPGWDKETDEGLSDELIDLQDRLFAASRCSTQLIMVDVPPVTTATSTAT
ncbi:uncharacterized protein [Littorina saxatilis]|uniref:uncharacterized protein n=1 Tax=Littorina saxatilis TaxID=31220 RepID=UPI0038B495F6